MFSKSDHGYRGSERTVFTWLCRKDQDQSPFLLTKARETTLGFRFEFKAEFEADFEATRRKLAAFFRIRLAS